MPRNLIALVALLTALFLPAAARADVIPVSSGSTTSTGNTASFSLNVPAGNDRLLAVGVSTTEGATVSSVSFGPQVLTRVEQSAGFGVRSEIWAIKMPNTGTANVTVTLSGAAPSIVGATTFAGVDQLGSLFSAAALENSVSNNVMMTLNNTVEKDGMFGTIVVSNAGNISAIDTAITTDTVKPDLRWSATAGDLRGAGASRRGNTGQNMALTTGISFSWFRNQSQLSGIAGLTMPMKASTGPTPPSMSNPTATAVTHNAATLGGTMDATGGSSITGRGVVYCACANPVIGGAGVSNATVAASDTTGAFTVGVSSLAASTAYTYRAYATNAVGTAYTNPANFTTSAPPNQPPTASAGGPYTTLEGSSVTLHAAATDPEGQPLTYAWDVDGDSQYDDATGADPTVAAADLAAIGLGDGPDSSSVRVRVTDGTSATTSNATTLTITNVAPAAGLGNGGSAEEGGTATVSFSGQSDPSAADRTAGFRYAYDFDDDGNFEVGDGTYAGGTTSASATVPASYLADGPGTRTVLARLLDKDGGQHTYETTITITNVAPSATLGNGGAVVEGHSGAVSFTGASDPSPADSAAGLRYAYDFDNDGTYDLGGPTYAGASTSASVTVPASFLPNGPATRTVRGAVLDKDGGLRTYTTDIAVTNAAPTAAFSNRTVDEGDTVTISLSNVDDVAADLGSLRYAYDFDNDGTYDVGSTTYATASNDATGNVPKALVDDGPGTRTMKIAVVDRDGGVNAYTATVTVRNVAPTGTLVNGGDIDEGATARVNWTGVTDPSTADAAAGTRYAYDFDGDGTYDLGGTTYATAVPDASVDVPKAYTADGAKTLTVKAAVIDKDGGVHVDTTTLDVANAAPTATLTGATVEESTPATVAFSAQADASAADTAAGFTYEYDLDDDGVFEIKGSDASATLPAALTANGPATRKVHAAIVDKDGGRSVYDATVTVVNAAPKATLSGPDAAPSNGVVTLSFGASDVSSQDALSGDVDWGDGKSEPVAGGKGDLSHTYAAPGAYTVTYVVRDADGGVSTKVTHTVTVAAPPATPAAPAPSTGGVAGAEATSVKVTRLRVTPGCIRSPNLRATASRTMVVRFSLSAPGSVKFDLRRWRGKGGVSKCPPSRGVAQKDTGKRVPGVYSPFSARAVGARKGANTLVLATTKGKRGKVLKPGTYLLRITVLDSKGKVVGSARTKVWVLSAA